MICGYSVAGSRPSLSAGRVYAEQQGDRGIPLHGERFAQLLRGEEPALLVVAPLLTATATAATTRVENFGTDWAVRGSAGCGFRAVGFTAAC